MQPKRYILCGGVDVTVPEEFRDDVLQLHLYGNDDENKMFLCIEEMRKSIFSHVPARFQDLLDIATYVFGADQLTRRGQRDAWIFGDRWRRSFHFIIPVRDIEFWQSEEVDNCLRNTLGFLSDDQYKFDFIKTKRTESIQTFFKINAQGEMLGTPDQVMMFSGGIDSLGGAVEEIINQKRNVLLVNHRSTEKMDKRHRTIEELLQAKAPINPPTYLRMTVKKKKWMNKEYTQRSRSFLYVALGATIATMIGQSSLRFYENGIISMNLPVCAQVVGGKATRTTHPRVLFGFQQLISLLSEKPFTVENAFFWKTKGEIVSLIEKAGCADLLEHSVSCTHTWEMTKQHSHCGTCSQCIDRRFAVIAAGLEAFDPISNYKVDVFTQGRENDLEKSDNKTLFASYLERANQVDRVTSCHQFLAQYAEVSRVLRYVENVSGSALLKIFELYRRHAAEVNTVTEKMLAFYAKEIRQRSLPIDCMIRIIHESVLPSSLTALPKIVIEESVPPNTFRQKGDVWEIRFHGKDAFSLNTKDKGAKHIAYLLSHPNVKFSVTEIIFGILRPGYESTMTDLGTMDDEISIRQLRDEFQELGKKIDTAEKNHDPVLLDRLTEEQHQIIDRLQATYNIKGKLRTTGSPVERARKMFINAVLRVRNRIAKYDSEFADYLKVHIHCGVQAYYEPKDQMQWETKSIHSE